jgi:hypothetical protein
MMHAQYTIEVGPLFDRVPFGGVERSAIIRMDQVIHDRRIGDRFFGRDADQLSDARAPVDELSRAICLRHDLVERAVRHMIADLSQERRAIVSAIRVANDCSMCVGAGVQSHRPSCRSGLRAATQRELPRSLFAGYRAQFRRQLGLPLVQRLQAELPSMELDTELVDVAGHFSPLRFIFLQLVLKIGDLGSVLRRLLDLGALRHAQRLVTVLAVDGQTCRSGIDDQRDGAMLAIEDDVAVAHVRKRSGGIGRGLHQPI